LTPEDVLFLTPKFWQTHLDPIITMDGAATTLMSIQLNLAAGTLAPFALERPELLPLLEKILNFEVKYAMIKSYKLHASLMLSFLSAQFLLTELSHGLDAPNLETTATLQPDGSFILNTPHPSAAKYMPPTGPFGGIPKVAIVIARLIIEGEESEDRGVRPFIVTLGDGEQMAQGISARSTRKCLLDLS
jgi:acyl-CoA oxidase